MLKMLKLKKKIYKNINDAGQVKIKKKNVKKSLFISDNNAQTSFYTKISPFTRLYYDLFTNA